MMRELRPHLDLDRYFAAVARMRETDGLRLAAASVGGKFGDGVVAVRLGLPVLLAFICAGCVTLSAVRIPLGEPSGEMLGDASRITIEDLRKPRDREVHRGKDISSCERWFGDDTFEPSKLVYLTNELAARTRADARVHLRLERFDIVEYCEYSASGNASAAAAVASGQVPGFTPAPVIGDTVIMRISGEVNGTRFDVTREFDYATLYRSPELPSSNPMYRQLLRARLDDMITEITNIVWRDTRQSNASSGITGNAGSSTGASSSGHRTT